MLERICLARFDVQRMMPTLDDSWREVEEQYSKLRASDDPIDLPTPEQVIPTLAQSVYASTRIEGEEVLAHEVPLAIVGQVDQKQSSSDDYASRVKGAQDAYKAYVWALSQPSPLHGGGLVSSEFVIELHRRMFSRTKPRAAGRFKDSANQIELGGRVVLRMLDPERVVEFIERLCTRLNSQFLIAENTGRYSKLIAVGEFVLDLLAIHPFADGNGRIARLLSTYLLERAGFHFARFYSLDSVILDRQTEYYRVLLDSQRGWYTQEENLSPWIEFYISAVFAQWLRALEEIRRHREGS